MKKSLNKVLRIAYNILFVPNLLFIIFNLVSEIAGYPFVDDMLTSLQIPFTAHQLVNVGFVIITAWLLCFFGSLWLNQKEKQASEEIEAKTHIAPDFESNQTDEALRRADMDVTSRILLKKMVGAYHICYRRVGSTNELIVNGVVYDEMKAVVEFKHDLCATVDGHEIHAGYDGLVHNYIAFDGQQVAKNLRLF